MLNQNARSNISWKPDTAYYTGQKTNHCHQLFATVRRTKPQCCCRTLQGGRPTNTGLLKSRICEWGSRSHPWSRKLRCAFRAGECFRCLIKITSTILENESTSIAGLWIYWALDCRHSLVHAHKWFLIEDFRVIRPLPNLNFKHWPLFLVSMAYFGWTLQACEELAVLWRAMVAALSNREEMKASRMCSGLHFCLPVTRPEEFRKLFFVDKHSVQLKPANLWQVARRVPLPIRNPIAVTMQQ